jgi:hypothetical protein
LRSAPRGSEPAAPVDTWRDAGPGSGVWALEPATSSSVGYAVESTTPVFTLAWQFRCVTREIHTATTRAMAAATPDARMFCGDACARVPVLGTGAAGSVKAWPRCSTTGHAGCRRRTTRGLACCGGSNKGQTALAVAARPLAPPQRFLLRRACMSSHPLLSLRCTCCRLEYSRAHSIFRRWWQIVAWATTGRISLSSKDGPDCKGANMLTNPTSRDLGHMIFPVFFWLPNMSSRRQYQRSHDGFLPPGPSQSVGQRTHTSCVLPSVKPRRSAYTHVMCVAKCETTYSRSRLFP